MSSSIFGGSLRDPEPFPLPPVGPEEPQGDWFLNIDPLFKH